MPPSDLIIRAIRPDDVVNKLSLGVAEFTPLKIFLKKDAVDFDKAHVARTHVLVEKDCASKGGRVWAFITLVASEVKTAANNKPPPKRWPTSYAVPAIKIARMAVDQELQRKGIGKKLLDLAIGLAKEHVSPHVGCRLLLTDAKKSAVSFYADHGFTMLDTPENQERKAPVMFICLAGL